MILSSIPNLSDKHTFSPPSVHRPLAPEDQELLREDEILTPVKPEGIRKKERPTDKGMSWLVKTQYISPLTTDEAKMVMPADSSINIVTYIVLDYFIYTKNSNLAIPVDH